MNSRFDALFSEWAKKEKHAGRLFNRDGIVNEEEWNASDKKILFLLKEAYHKTEMPGDTYDLSEDLNSNGPWSNIWYRVADWTRAIMQTEENRIPSYKKLSHDDANNYLRKIAVVNIKKSGGTSTSRYDNLKGYAQDDAEELLTEIELINPDIIVCCYSFDYLNIVLSIANEQIDKAGHPNDNYHYRWRDKTVIDYYHPAAHTDALQSFYGIVGCYHDSLLYAVIRGISSV